MNYVRAVVNDIRGRYLFTLTYLILCFVIAMPFNYSNFRLLYTEDGIPAGADPAFHAYAILRILDTNNPLLIYTAFPSIASESSSSSYYPSLMHLTVASISRIGAGVDQSLTTDPIYVIEVLKIFMLVVSLAGTLGYAMLIKTILNKLVEDKLPDHRIALKETKYRVLYLIICILAFGIFVYSISPIVKTFNDGSYGHIFAMWCIFPYYMYLLLNRRWIVSSVLLAVIASSHNLAFMMSLAATIPYLISLALQKKLPKWNLAKAAIVFIVFASPALIFFYLPAANLVLEGRAAESAYIPLSSDMLADQLKPGLYYMGLGCIVLALLLNSRILGWISGWTLIYFIVFSFSLLIGQRFARELSVTFGLLIGICISYILMMLVLTGKKWSKQRSIGINNTPISSFKLITVICVSTAIVSLSYLYFEDRFYSDSNPDLVKYFTSSIGESNRYILTSLGKHNGDSKPVIALFGDNPWLKVMTYGEFEILGISPDNTPYLSRGDKLINDELAKIVSSPDVLSTGCNIDKYGIDYVYISDKIPGRWYSEYSGEAYHKSLSFFQRLNSSPFLFLEKEFFGEEGEVLRIYAINHNNLKHECT